MNIRKWLTRITVSLVVLFAVPALGVSAKDGESKAPVEFVEDLSSNHVVSNSTIDYIGRLNDNSWASLPGKPHYYLKVVDSIRGSKFNDIGDFGDDSFLQYKLGRTEWSNDVLFTIAIEDHKYRLTAGIGLSNFLTSSKAQDYIVPREVKRLLRAEDYDQAILLISQNIESYVKTNSGDILTPSEVSSVRKKREEQAKKEEESAKSMETFSIMVGVVACLVIFALLVEEIFNFIHTRKQFKMLRNDYKIFKDIELTVDDIDDYSFKYKDTAIAFEQQIKDMVDEQRLADELLGSFPVATVKEASQGVFQDMEFHTYTRLREFSEHLSKQVDPKKRELWDNSPEYVNRFSRVVYGNKKSENVDDRISYTEEATAWTQLMDVIQDENEHKEKLTSQQRGQLIDLALKQEPTITQDNLDRYPRYLVDTRGDMGTNQIVSTALMMSAISAANAHAYNSTHNSSSSNNSSSLGGGGGFSGGGGSIGGGFSGGW